MRLSAAMIEALRDADACALYKRRESGRYVRSATVDALILRDLLSPRFPHAITDKGRAELRRIDGG